MNIKQILLISAISLTIMPAIAYTTMDELTSPEQLVNYNYSKVTADHVQLIKAQNSNSEFRTERLNKRPWYKKFWSYIDPSYDDETLLQHSISPVNSWKDY